jgi:choice-of-anchor C domain-containing protein
MELRRPVIRVAAALLLAAAALTVIPAVTGARAADANLIVNGSFEDPSVWQTSAVTEYAAGATDMPGWTVGGNGVDLVGETYWNAEDGDQSLDLSGTAPGSVTQAVTTTPGANYTLTWYMAGNTNCGQAIKTMDVSWDGTVVDSPSFDDSGDSGTSMGWVELQLNVTAASASSTLEFADATPDGSQCGSTLDNVSLVPATIASPVFTEENPALVGLQGSPYSAVFFAAGVPDYSLAGAPSWLSITPYGAVTGTPPAGTGSFTYTVSASNADGSAQAGPFTVNVQTAALISGKVVDGGIAASPVNGAPVQACVTGTSECTQATTAADGTYQVNAPVGASVSVTAFPVPGSGDVTTSTAPMTVPAAGITGVTISLDGVAPISGGLEINGSDAPTVYWANPSTATVTGCPDGEATVSVIGDDTATGQFTSDVVVLTETPEGSGNYSGTIPPQEPVHGPVQVQSSLICPPQSALSPNEGPAAGGTTVILTGSGFTGATGVSFGTAPATSFTVLSDDGIEAVAPPGAGTVPVSVQVGGASVLVDQYTYQAIQSISPASGPAAGGTWVVISGTGLDSATTVEFAGVDAEFYQLSDTEIEALSPAGTGTQDITVTTAFGGTTPATAADEFTYGASTTAAESTAARPHAAAVLTAVRRQLVLPATSSGSASASTARSAISTDAVTSTATSSLKVLNFIYEYGPGLLTGAEDINKIIKNILPPNPNCSDVEGAIKAQLNIAVGPIAEALADATLPELETLEVEAGLAGGPVGIAISVVVFSLTPLLWHYFWSQIAEVYVDAAVKAYYGECPDSDYEEPPPPLPFPPPPPGNTPPSHGFTPNTFIDPSGTVLDTNGNPVSGATVTILRADTAAGPFTPLSAASPGIEPNVNPETTGDDGVFHWDVFSGWYEIQASAPGCTDQDNPDNSTVTAGPYPVPPPQVGLTLTLACPDEAAPAVPAVTSLSESTGPSGGGTAVTVLGSGFTPASTVTFGGTAAKSVTYLSPQALTVVSPSGSGLVDVVVGTAGGHSATSAADQFYYGSSPTVTGLSPAAGPAAGGTTVTIAGTGFTRATAVGFGSQPASSFTVVSDTEIKAAAPPETAGSVDVEVVTPAGDSAQSAADQYTYAAEGTAPAITSTGSATLTAGTAGSFTVTTSGAPAAAVTESGTLPSGVTFTDNGDGTATLAGTSAAGTGGTYPLTITASNGTAPDATQSFTLTVDEAPAITSQASATLIGGVGDSVTVTTTGFPVPVLAESGSLPAGVTFTGNGNGTATITATANAASVTTFRITASNGVSPAATQTFTLTVTAQKSAMVLLRASRKSAVSGEPIILAAVSSKAPAAGFAIDIIDLTTGTVIASCATGHLCLATVANGAGTHNYQASIATPAGTGTQASSTPVSVTWVPAAVTLRASRTTAVNAQPVLLSAHANEAVAGTGYAIDIVDTTTNGIVASCTHGSSCSIWVQHRPGSSSYKAIIATLGGHNVQASSPVVTVTWLPSTIRLQPSNLRPALGSEVMLTATANEDVGYTPWAIIITDLTTGTVIADCRVGNRCFARVSHISGRHTYQAVIAGAKGADVQARSAAETVTWSA